MAKTESQRAYMQAYREKNKEGIKQQRKDWYRRNKESVRVYNAAQYSKNAERNRARTRAWHDANPEASKAQNAEWHKRNRAAASEKTGRRRAAVANAAVAWADAAVIADLYTLAAVYRGCGINAHVDHILPLRAKLVCGLHVEHNLTVILAEDNLRKKNKYTPEIIQNSRKDD